MSCAETRAWIALASACSTSKPSLLSSKCSECVLIKPSGAAVWKAVRSTFSFGSSSKVVVAETTRSSKKTSAVGSADRPSIVLEAVGRVHGLISEVIGEVSGANAQSSVVRAARPRRGRTLVGELAMGLKSALEADTARAAFWASDTSGSSTALHVHSHQETHRRHGGAGRGERRRAERGSTLQKVGVGRTADSPPGPRQEPPELCVPGF